MICAPRCAAVLTLSSAFLCADVRLLRGAFSTLDQCARKAGGLAFQGDITPPVSLEIEACLTSRDHAASTVNCAFSAMLNAVEAAPTAAMAGASRASAPRHSLDVLPRSAAQIRPWGPLQPHERTVELRSIARSQSSGSQHFAAAAASAAQVEAPQQAHVAYDALKVKQSAEPFNWTEQWYPLASTRDLDPGRPHSVMLLGMKLVLWRDGEGKWSCFEDRCPHRAVPLSEGRIEESDGSLMCGYHGWRFNGKGDCVDIPQLRAKADNIEQAALNNKRACATYYPTQEKQGLVWVWASSGPAALQKSREQEPIVNAHMEANQEGYMRQFDNYVRDVPGGMGVWVENSCDQSHVAFAHHGLVGSRGGEREGQFNGRPVDGPTAENPNSFAFEFDFSSNGKRLSTINMTWNPPSQLMFQPRFAETFQLWINAVPVSPVCTRLIINSGGWNVPIPKWLKKLREIPFFQEVFSVLGHLQLNAVNDGDIVFMHQQHNNAYSGNPQETRRSYFMPAESDKGVTAWLNWLSSRGNSGPPFTKDAPTATMWDSSGKLRREELLDRYSQHTKHCSICSRALRRVQRAQTLVLGALAAEFLAAAALLRTAPSLLAPPILGVVAAALLSAVLLVKLRQFERCFTFTDWSQAELKPVKD